MSLTFKDLLAQDLETTFFNVNEHAELVTITRASRRTIDVAAIVATRDYQRTVLKGGVGETVRSLDFDIIATKYQCGDTRVDPRDGDKITRANGEVYQAMPMPERMCFEPVSDGLIVRVHTKRIKSD